MLSTAGRVEIAGVSPAKLFSLKFARRYMVTMRPYLLFVSGITGMAGLALSGETDAPGLLLYSIVFFLSYGFGQALTDCFQTDTDSISSPYRPLVRGRIARRDVLIVSLTGLVAGGALLVSANVAIIPWALLSISGLATYTFFKRRWWGGPFYNAWIVGALCLIGYLGGSPGSSLSDVGLRAWAAIATAFFGYANFVLVGYYKDVPADRATGYNTFPVVFGLKTSAVASDIITLFTAGSFATAIWLVLRDATGFADVWPMAPFAVLGILILVRAQIEQHKVQNEAQAHKAISHVLHAYILLLAAICVAARTAWALPLAVFYLAFIAVFNRRPARGQI